MPALHADIFHCCRPCLRRLDIQHRFFATSPARRKHGPLPTFNPTPSPELDTLLSTFRSNVFLPSHLIKLQRDLLYKKKNLSLLTADEPATVRVGDELIQLYPLDHMRDEPPTRPSFHKVLGLMEETGDWKNLSGFLEGLKTANRKLKSAQIERLVRKASEAGRQGVVHDCLRRVEGTGVGLWNVRVAREAIWGAVLKAVQGAWSEEAVEKAVKYADNLWELMWDPRHLQQATIEEDTLHPRFRPEILGVLMQLHATKAVMFGGGKDEGGVAMKYKESMLKSWGIANLKFDENDWQSANYMMLMWAPVWHGMKMIQRMEAESSSSKGVVAKETSDVFQDLEQILQKSQQAVAKNPPQGGQRRGLKLYEDLSSVNV